MKNVMHRLVRRAFVIATIVAPAVLPAITVKTVPWVPTDASIPHDTYAGKAITLKGTADVQGGNFQATWNFADGSPNAVFTITNKYDVSTTHTYVGAVGTVWTATLTVKDTTGPGCPLTCPSASATYKVAMRATNLSTQVNVAIDEGLWWLHKTQRRYTLGITDYGDWLGGCGGLCSGYIAVTVSDIQAFEVSGHLESGPASNPYTETVARGMRSLFANLSAGAIAASRTLPYAMPPSCPVPPCTITLDNAAPGGSPPNGLAAYDAQTGRPFYAGGMYIDTIVASGTPNAVATSGPANIIGRSYKDITQDLVDGYLNCQYGGSQGGGWRYSCGDFPDNSACQWGAIGLIAAERAGFATVPANAKSWNRIWLAYSQAGNGVFGYTSTGPIWGPFATTPSGMVQMAMDGIGRGDASGRWEKSETLMRDNFGNTGGPYSAPKDYFYGLFSFTKSMLLHAPGGVLTPITMLHSTTSGVPDLDWYGAEVSAGAPTDGVARMLVNRQNAAGYWYGWDVDGNQQLFDTSWAIIMLRRTVFTACVTDLKGRGTAGNTLSPARVDLTWTALTGADHYTVLRGSAAGGPYVPIGTATTNKYSDTTGLTNGATYYYVLQPATAAGGAICQSSEARVTVPVGR